MFKAQLGQRGDERVSQEVTGWRGGSGNASASEEAEDGELRLTAGCVRREGRSQENRLLGFYTEASENGEDAFVGKDEGGRWMKNDTGLCQHTLSENILGPLRETKWGVMAFDCHEVQLTRFTPSLPPPPQPLGAIPPVIQDHTLMYQCGYALLLSFNETKLTKQFS